jgi:hypothetical protein
MESSQQAIPSPAKENHRWTREITPAAARSFLTELANLRREEPQSLIRFSHAFGPWIETFFDPLIERVENATQPRALDSAMSLGALLMTAAIGPVFGPLLSLQEVLRRGWERPTAKERELAVLGMLLDASRLYEQAKGRVFAVIGEPLGVILLEAIHSADSMRICGNIECPAPYFIASRRSQKFCSDACALPAQREYKRRWWNEHGAAWQKNRSRKQGRGKTKTVRQR